MSVKKGLLFKISTDIREFQKGMRQATTDLRRFGNQMKDMSQGMNTYVTLPIALAGAGAIKMASDYQESLNKVNQSFRTSSGEVQAWAKNSLTSFGMAEGTALDAAALYGDMATSMGFTTDKAADMAMALTKLAGDLKSFKNIPISQAMTAPAW
jgi:CRISPR/Cas system type I-B associated protein Csh2 (Cas7 group RAMP superfamily)